MYNAYYIHVYNVYYIHSILSKKIISIAGKNIYVNTLQKRVNGRRVVGAEVISPSSNMTATVCSHMHSYSAPKSSCAWIHVDNDVNTSHSKGDKEPMGQKKGSDFS